MDYWYIFISFIISNVDCQMVGISVYPESIDENKNVTLTCTYNGTVNEIGVKWFNGTDTFGWIYDTSCTLFSTPGPSYDGSRIVPECNDTDNVYKLNIRATKYDHLTQWCCAFTLATDVLCTKAVQITLRATTSTSASTTTTSTTTTTTPVTSASSSSTSTSNPTTTQSTAHAMNGSTSTSTNSATSGPTASASSNISTSTNPATTGSTASASSITSTSTNPATSGSTANATNNTSTVTSSTTNNSSTTNKSMVDGVDIKVIVPAVVVPGGLVVIGVIILVVVVCIKHRRAGKNVHENPDGTAIQDKGSNVDGWKQSLGHGRVADKLDAVYTTPDGFIIYQGPAAMSTARSYKEKKHDDLPHPYTRPYTETCNYQTAHVPGTYTSARSFTQKDKKYHNVGHSYSRPCTGTSDYQTAYVPSTYMSTRTYPDKTKNYDYESPYQTASSRLTYDQTKYYPQTGHYGQISQDVYHRGSGQYSYGQRSRLHHDHNGRQQQREYSNQYEMADYRGNKAGYRHTKQDTAFYY